MPAALHVESGALVAHRLLDVANEIDLARAETLWLARAGGESRRTQFSTASANELPSTCPPALLVLPSTGIDLDGRSAAGRR